MVTGYAKMTADEIRRHPSAILDYRAYDDAELLQRFERGEARFVSSLPRTSIWELDNKRFVVHDDMICGCDPMQGDCISGAGS